MFVYFISTLFYLQAIPAKQHNTLFLFILCYSTNAREAAWVAVLGVTIGVFPVFLLLGTGVQNKLTVVFLRKGG